MPELHPGVGACGRRPLRVRRPRGSGVRGGKGGRLKEQCLYIAVRGRWGAGGLRRHRGSAGLCWLPEMVLPVRRFAIFRLGGRTGRPRVPEGDSGGLPEIILGSPKVILELPGGHFGLFEGHF